MIRYFLVIPIEKLRKELTYPPGGSHSKAHYEAPYSNGIREITRN
jgi:hypothetical protein